MSNVRNLHILKNTLGKAGIQGMKERQIYFDNNFSASNEILEYNPSKKICENINYKYIPIPSDMIDKKSIYNSYTY